MQQCETTLENIMAQCFVSHLLVVATLYDTNYVHI